MYIDKNNENIEIRSRCMKENNNLDFYRNTSLFTDLGFYKSFAKNLPDDIETLCLLLRNQIIHPFDLKDEEERKNPNSFYGDMTKIPRTSLIYENDLFPSAIAMMAELLRRNSDFTRDRKIEDKIHVCCRETSILLISILKAKNIPARTRCGFTYSVSEIEGAGDHWIVEYYDETCKRWILVDPTMYYDQETLEYFEIDYSLIDMPRDKFIFAADAYLGLRNKKYKTEDIYCFSNPKRFGIKAAINELFYDFHSLMNNEILFCQSPKYLKDNNYELTDEEYSELDELATLMLDPDKNFDLLNYIWKNNEKFRIMCGGMNG